MPCLGTKMPALALSGAAVGYGFAEISKGEGEQLFGKSLDHVRSFCDALAARLPQFHLRHQTPGTLHVGVKNVFLGMRLAL